MFARTLLALSVSMGLSGCVCLPAPGCFAYGPRLLPPMLVPPVCAMTPNLPMPCAPVPARMQQPMAHYRPIRANRQVVVPRQKVAREKIPHQKVVRPQTMTASLPKVEFRRPKWPSGKMKAKTYPGVVKDSPKSNCDCRKCREHRQAGCRNCKTCKTGCVGSQPNCKTGCSGGSQCMCAKCGKTVANGPSSCGCGESIQHSHPTRPAPVPPVEVYKTQNDSGELVPPPAPLPSPLDDPTSSTSTSNKRDAETAGSLATETVTPPQKRPASELPASPSRYSGSETSPEASPARGDEQPRQRASDTTPIPLDPPPRPAPFEPQPNAAPVLDAPETFENSEIEPVSFKIPVRQTGRTSDNSKMGDSDYGYETMTIPASSVIRRRIQ